MKNAKGVTLLVMIPDLARTIALLVMDQHFSAVLYYRPVLGHLAGPDAAGR